MAKPELLFLAHRIPFPPDKGDKIRAYHVLRHLTQHWRVHLGCFVDEPVAPAHRAALQALCGDTYFAPLGRARLLARAGLGVLRGQSLTQACYRDAGLARWIADLAARPALRAAFACSGAAASYLLPHSHLHRVADLVDVDSAKWAEYAQRRRPPLRWIFAREAARLATLERTIARTCNETVFVSPAEAALFTERSGQPAHALANGVDGVYFDPNVPYARPWMSAGPVLVFTGVMDYWPNVDAVVWFANHVMPILRARFPALRFYIVGRAPTAAVRRLHGRAGVFVTGTVPDVRPYLAHADAVVAPLRLARGVQNKVLEAMAMARAVVVSPQALAGVEARPGEQLLVAAGAPAYAEAVAHALGPQGAVLGAAARAHVLHHYAWDTVLRRLDTWLAPALAAPVERPDARIAAAGARA